MNRKKLVIIGAGSAMFTQGLVADLILSQQPWQIGLVDIDPLALQVAEGLARRMVQARGADVSIEASLDRCDLLPGADVVATTIGVGGRRAWEADVFIPRKYGIYQPVGDTAMAGGISRAMRLIPAMVEIAQDVVRLCPNAYFFNYANPMSVICWAVRKATGANIVGLCIGVHHVRQELADFVGLPRDEVTCQAVGVNHFTWVHDLRWQGQDAWPLVREKLAAEKAEGSQPVGMDESLVPGGDTTMAPEDWAPRHGHNPLSWSLFEAYGAYPAVNDRHVCEFFPERFPNGAYYGKKLGVDVYSFEGCIAFGDAIYEQMRAQAMGETPLDQGVFERALGEHSQLLEILDSIEHDKRWTYSANLPNLGAIPTLPAHAILEMTSAATGRGLQPFAVPDFPALLAAPLIRKIAAHEITVEAALTGSRKLFVEALLVDGCVSDPAMAEKLAAELLEAQAAYLPQFA
jgi:alpha-galactosidase